MTSYTALVLTFSVQLMIAWDGQQALSGAVRGSGAAQQRAGVLGKFVPPRRVTSAAEKPPEKGRSAAAQARARKVNH